ncbi:MAG: MFS transporter [Alphaproteobacteria bacterium]|nr:MFS transporter [Alphaproteobacteria bacterium]
MSESSTGQPPARGSAYVVLLAVLIGLSLMDRQILSIIAEPLKHEFALTDTLLGILSGMVFALVFAFASLPIAWSADHISRTGILTICATTWALCTVGMGTALGYTQLVIARMGLAIGEAGCNPCAQSLIADYVPVERRNRAMAIYSMGGPAGVITAGIAGGLLTDAYGWRVALYVLGGVSLALALVASLILPEPKRSSAHADATTNGGFLTLTRKPAFRYIIGASAFGAIAIYGGLAWGTVFVVRYFHWTPGEAGAVFGTLGAVIALGGTWLGGPAADYLSKRDKRWQMWLPAIVILLSIPFSVFSIFSLTIPVLIIASSGETFLRTISFAPLAAALQRLAPDNARARAAATAGVTGTLVGLGLGPTIVGALSDGLAPWAGADSLRYGLLSMVIPQFLAAICCWQAAKSIDKDFLD